MTAPSETDLAQFGDGVYTADTAGGGKCKYCDGKVTHRVVHADGRAVVKVDEQHITQAKRDIHEGGSTPERVDEWTGSSWKRGPDMMSGDHALCQVEAELYGTAFCLATRKPGLCLGQHRPGTVLAPPKPVNIPAAPVAPVKQPQVDAGYQQAYLRAAQVATAAGLSGARHGEVRAAMHDYAKALHGHQQAEARAQSLYQRAQGAHNTAVQRQAAQTAAYQARQAAATARAQATTARATLHHAARRKAGNAKLAVPAGFALDLYGVPTDFGLYGLLSWEHQACEVGAFCRNPLHPGPCKGWKHMLHSVAPGAYHAYEQQRVAKLNEKRVAKIKALQALGHPVPKHLLKEHTYLQVPHPPGSTPYVAPTPKEAVSKLPATANEIGQKIALKHAGIAEKSKKKAAEDKAVKLAQADAFGRIVAAFHDENPAAAETAKGVFEKYQASLEPGSKVSESPWIEKTAATLAEMAVKKGQLDPKHQDQIKEDILAHIEHGSPGIPVLVESAINNGKKKAAHQAEFQKKLDMHAKTDFAKASPGERFIAHGHMDEIKSSPHATPEQKAQAKEIKAKLSQGAETAKLKAETPSALPHVEEALKVAHGKSGVDPALGHDVAPHVKAAQSAATGSAYMTDTKKVAAYAKLSPEEYHALPHDVQVKIQDHLHAAHEKFVSPAKKKQVQDVLTKLGGPQIPGGAGAPHGPSVHAVQGEKMATAHDAALKLATASSVGLQFPDKTAKTYQTHLEHGTVGDAVDLNAKHLADTWAANHLTGLPLEPEEHAAIKEKAQAEFAAMIKTGTTAPPHAGVLWSGANYVHTAGGAFAYSPAAQVMGYKHAVGIATPSSPVGAGAGGGIHGDAGKHAGGTTSLPTYVPGSADMPVKAPSGAMSHDKATAILGAFKMQTGASQLKHDPADLYDNLLAVSKHYGVTLRDAMQAIDEQHAANLGVSNSGLLEKKITEWLKTPEGAAYAAANTKPKAKYLDPLAGKVHAPKGMKLKPGEKVPTLPGPGAYSAKLKADDFKPLTSPETIASQQKYMDATGQKWTPQQESALVSYTFASGSMNDYLRGQDHGPSKALQQKVVDAQAAMRPLQQHTLLARGAGYMDLPEGFRSHDGALKLIGKTFEADGFVSTSTAGDGGAVMSGPLVYIIEAPQGTMGAAVDHISDFPGEREVVLAAGTRFHVISVKGTQNATEIRVRVVGPKSPASKKEAATA